MVAPQFPEALRVALERSKRRHPQRLLRRRVYLSRQVLVADLAKDPFWLERRDPALAAGLRASWSTPIQAAGGKVLGSLGVYRREPGLPTPAESQIMARAAQLAGIAIERRLAEEALRSKRGEVPRSVREYRRRASSERAGRPAACRSIRHLSARASGLPQRPRSCTRCQRWRRFLESRRSRRVHRRIESKGRFGTRSSSCAGATASSW